MSEIVIDSPTEETIIEFGDGTVLETTVNEEVMTVISTPADSVVIDLNSGPRGEPGDRIFSGAGYPLPEMGGIGDLYILTGLPGSIGTIYRKVSETGWTEEGNIRGPAGGIDSVNGYTGPSVVLTPGDFNIGNVDNTSDEDKPVSTAQQAALDLKSNIGHTHVRADITDLQAALDGKSNVGHAHAISDITGLISALNAKESAITVGTVTQYYRGDKSWQTLDKAAVGLGNADNTSDANKPVSTATQTALNSKENTIAAGTTAQYYRGDKSWQTLNPAAAGLGNVANLAQVDLVNAQTIAGVKTFSVSPIVPTPTTGTQAANKSYVDSAATAAANAIVDAAPGTLDTLNELAAALGDDPNFATTITTSIATKEPVIATGTTAQFWRGDKTWVTPTKSDVGLANVDNTSDASKPVSTATQTALNGKANTVHGHALTDANITGVLPIAQIPTGTTSTTVALGNHIHSIYVENTGNETIAGVKTFTSSPTVAGLNATYGASNGIIELGRTDGVAGGGYLDFHSGTTVVDYDTRIAGTGGSGANGGGTMTLYAAAFNFITGTITGNGSGLTTLNATNLSSGTVNVARLGNAVIRVNHGATASTARPTGAAVVQWFGSVAPTNATTNDEWINTA